MRVSKQAILVVDDDLVDVMTIRRAFKQLNVTNRIDHALHGEAALALLESGPAQRPCIILLDLNMPVMNGLEFLAIIKQHDSFKSIPVIMLTTSEEQKDKLRSFDLGVAGYMTKPVDYPQFVEMMRSIDLYWTISQLP
jgi:CheY-like chemotaxis protein